MFGLTTRRSAVLVAVVCVGLGTGAGLAVQASASGGKPTGPSAPPSPASPPIRPRTTNGQLVPAAVSTNAHCGQTLTASLTLNGDLFCPATGLIVSGNSVVLNLGGHEIASNQGDGSTYYGVVISGKSDTVENGLVADFASGVYISGTTDIISGLRSSDSNGTGFEDHGQGTKITNSVASGSKYNGIFSQASGGTYSGDHEVSNGYAGLALYGQKMTITSNIANGNTIDGIYDGAFATTLTKNSANFNGQDGIYVDEVAVIDGAGNTAKGNDYVTGYPPEQCHGVVCS
jgi:hypothetical protein